MYVTYNSSNTVSIYMVSPASHKEVKLAKSLKPGSHRHIQDTTTYDLKISVSLVECRDCHTTSLGKSCKSSQIVIEREAIRVFAHVQNPVPIEKTSYDLLTYLGQSGLVIQASYQHRR